jgi:hypothetical protein
MKVFFLGIATALALALATAAQADESSRKTAFAFATAAQGGELLAKRDDFVLRLSPYDRAARMKSGSDVPEAVFLHFVATNVLEWNVAEKALVNSALSDLQPRLDDLALPFPKTIYFVKTTGAEEGGLEYTRGNGIILPKPTLDKSKRAGVKDIIAHELFHVLSRANPALKEKLYALIGFQPCGEIVFPTARAGAKITNPDAPKNDHCIRVKIGGEAVWAAPILYSKTAPYDAARGGEFIESAVMQFLVVERKGEGASASASYDPANPRLVADTELSGLYEQLGRNTNYIIHPEETLADNFRLFLLQITDVPSPEIPQKLGAALAGYKSG